MGTRVRVINLGDHSLIVGTPTSREFLSVDQSTTLECSEGNPVVITEYESDMNEVGALVLPEGFRQ